MTIIVEDGSVVAGANSYVTVSEADSYFSARADTVWTDSENEQKERALLLAAAYSIQKWRLRWRGSRVDALQRLDWPRRGVPVPDFFDPFFRQINVPLQFQDTYFIPEDTVPDEVKQMQFELARSVMNTAGLAANELQPNLSRKTKSEQVGPIKVEYFGAGDGERETIDYWASEQIIQPFLNPTKPYSAPLVRS